MKLVKCAGRLLVLGYWTVANVCVAEPTVAATGAGSVQQGRTTDVEKARTHFLQGVQFYNAGDYKLSLIEFRRSYELSKNGRILYNIGQVNQQLGNYTNALLALEQYLREGGTDVSDERRAEVTANIEVLSKRVAHVRVLSNVEKPEVLLDGFPVSVSNGEAIITVDPGDHRIDLRKSGYQTDGKVIALAAGDVNQVRIDLTRVPAAVRVATPTSHSTPQRDTTWLWVGWSTTAATALGAGVTGVLAVMQANELANLRNSSWSTEAQRDEIAGRAKLLAVTSDVLTAAAVAAGATSLYLTLRSGRTEAERRPAAETRLRLTAAGVRLEGTF